MSGVESWGDPEQRREKILCTERIGGRRTAEGCAARVAERHKGRKLGRGHKGTSNQLAAVDERDFGFLLSIDRKEKTILLL